MGGADAFPKGAAGCGRRALLAALAAPLAVPALSTPALAQLLACRGTIYLTIDTGWSREAEEIAAILRRRQVRATLFVADEPTFRGDRTLDDSWAPFWRARAAEGHVFASHTWRHWYFSGDPGPGRVRYASRRAGEGAEVLDGAALCAELRRPVERLKAMVPEAVVLPLWRAPGGRTTPNALALARACGLRHQGWTANGFLGDELDSDRSPNRALLARNLSAIRDGEVLLMHWGVRSRREPFAGILEPLLAGLQERGLCFAPLPREGRG
ncbi:polysaccharide deacetylase family protein [Roseomonas sp. OT10]|uniref:polysaccharide deacetylase family protein n=1 Tax=Roseomonas cutis TaxID=2897332 RepID=UPI001E65CD87|nr:polysaccharide deacetylase family protein [Roseomonas sp. OT10]UFN47851.1 polysaccharide deacetylase family protein [Roseomonas sp. OT10]